MLVNGIPVSVAYDVDSPHSHISYDFVQRFRLAVCSDRCGVFLSLPVVNGNFVTTFSFLLSHSLSDDLLLGSDWLGYCDVASRDNGVLFLPSSVEGRRIVLSAVSAGKYSDRRLCFGLKFGALDASSPSGVSASQDGRCLPSFGELMSPVFACSVHSSHYIYISRRIAQ